MRKKYYLTKTKNHFTKTNNMKLYTEEQIKKSFIAGCNFTFEDTEEYDEGLSNIVNKFTPIELPSDEEINEQASMYSNQCQEYRAGAKWIKEQIINQNK